ncbi:hypothetical protein D9757_005192 [Collybiopsis confluens]|uniref:F-box domain-containing protein n=1 Tax=Collybiopsis confluens TaxID=2823264 RepID=A0A8H5HW87_9AGAR|nr:hypothetical protein D9757_005192 [Collybiopsis confluens]
MVPELPLEIWWKILEYLPADASLIKLRTVNRTFLEIARSSLYQKLTIKEPDLQTEKLLRGHYVRSVHIQPWDIHFFLSVPLRRLHGRISSFSNYVRLLIAPGYSVRKDIAFLQKHLKEVMELITDTVKRLQHVREYTLNAEMDLDCDISVFNRFSSLLDISTFSRTLAKVTLATSAGTSACLGRVHLPVLEEFNLHLLFRPSVGFSDSTLNELVGWNFWESSHLWRFIKLRCVQPQSIHIL